MDVKGTRNNTDGFSSQQSKSVLALLPKDSGGFLLSEEGAASAAHLVSLKVPSLALYSSFHSVKEV